MWRRLPNESAAAVAAQFNLIFCERGPPSEVLLDNGACFRSREVGELSERWGVRQVFSCAHRPSGIGIVERNHMTVKRMAARSGNPAEVMVYYYNFTPNDDGLVPAETLYMYDLRVPNAASEVQEPLATRRCV